MFAFGITKLYSYVKFLQGNKYRDRTLILKEIH